jgi:transposase
MKRKNVKTFVGADLHKDFTHFIAQDKMGKELVSRKVDNNEVMMREFLGGLPQPVKVVVESTSNWAWFCEAVEEGGHEVVVAHARETSAMSDTRQKSDVGDARLLATLLRGNLIRRQCWHAPAEVLEIRERLRYMQFLTKQKVANKNRIHSILIRRNIKSPRKDVFCKSGREFLRGLDIEETYKRSILLSLGMIEAIEAGLETDLEFCRRMVAEDPLAALLVSLPGVNAHLACVIRFETGEIERFQRVESFVNYTGLVPGKRQSAGDSKSIGITKEGSFWLRWAFVQAVQTIDRQKGRLPRYFWKQYRKTNNRNKAIVATAREMATIAYHIMKKQQGYYEPLKISCK